MVEQLENPPEKLPVGTKRTVTLRADGNVHMNYGITLKEGEFDLKVDGMPYKVKFYIESVDPHSQAYQQGLVSGDVILSVTVQLRTQLQQPPAGQSFSSTSSADSAQGSSFTGSQRRTRDKSISGKTKGTATGMAVDVTRYAQSASNQSQTYNMITAGMSHFEEFLRLYDEIKLSVIYVNAERWSHLVKGKAALEREYREKELKLQAANNSILAIEQLLQFGPGSGFRYGFAGSHNNISAGSISGHPFQHRPQLKSESNTNNVSTFSKWRKGRRSSQEGFAKNTAMTRSQPNLVDADESGSIVSASSSHTSKLSIAKLFGKKDSPGGSDGGSASVKSTRSNKRPSLGGLSGALSRSTDKKLEQTTHSCS
ncbi:uncharacterized protein LOC142337749 isoform X3 [Convolutriloba macropyga]|uniref:uncharacterized protein LOC142337749 isoform X3 n=1 Tax=Convolutriloba macropyga TaxID=536237 RepID=UPI003F52866C